MDDRQASIEGQTIINAVTEMMCSPHFKPSSEYLIKTIFNDLFDMMAEKLADYKKKEETK